MRKRGIVQTHTRVHPSISAFVNCETYLSCNPKDVEGGGSSQQESLIRCNLSALSPSPGTLLHTYIYIQAAGCALE